MNHVKMERPGFVNVYDIRTQFSIFLKPQIHEKLLASWDLTFSIVSNFMYL